MKPHRRLTCPRSGRLFAEPPHGGPPADACIVNVDGASRGNPGPAAYAVVIRGGGGKRVTEFSKPIGRTTNNVAEYYALIAALDYAVHHGIRKLRVRSDSELLVRQMQGRYKVKSADLRPLHERATRLARSLEHFSIEAVPRELNSSADALANAALDAAGGHAPTNRKSKLEAHGGAGDAAPAALRVRARYRDGVVVPERPLELSENEEIEIAIYRPRRN